MTIIFTLAAFLFFKARDYYAIRNYPFNKDFGSVYISHILNKGFKKYLKPIVIAISLLLFIPYYNIGFPNKKPECIFEHASKYNKLDLLRWKDGKEHLLQQDYADMLGWRFLAKTVDS